MNFLEFKNFNDFKIKTGMQGNEAIIFLLNEIEKKECKINTLHPATKNAISGGRGASSEGGERC